MKTILARVAVAILVGGGLMGGAVAGDRVMPSRSTTELGYAVSGSKGMRLSRFVAPSAGTAEEAGVPDAFIPTPPGVMSEAQSTITGASGTGASGTGASGSDALADTRSAGLPMLGAGGITLEPVVRVLPDPRPLDAGGLPLEASAAAPEAVAQPARRKPLRVAGADSPPPALKRMPIVIGAFR
jgi:hypothetical protein